MGSRQMALCSASHHQVTRSWNNPNPFNTRIYRRNGNNEDPWIQWSDSHSQENALYMEGNYNANGGNGEGNRFQVHRLQSFQRLEE